MGRTAKGSAADCSLAAGEHDLTCAALTFAPNDLTRLDIAFVGADGHSATADRFPHAWPDIGEDQRVPRAEANDLSRPEIIHVLDR